MKKEIKATKAVSSLDVVNNDLKASFEAVVNLEAEISVYEKAVSMLNAQQISVRGLKATIEAAQEKGALPTIKPSTAQYFILSAKVRALAGGKDKPLKAVLNATIQAKRAFKSDAEAFINASKSFAELVNATPKQGERAKAGRKASPIEGLTADEIIERTLISLGELDNPFIENTVMAEALIKGLKALVNSSKSPNHPANRAKVSA